ncbi:MAG TPA: HAD-IIA family hydrolase [Mycobacterium sp.]|nr:MAG: HAD-IIA family hydrolase [Mycobacterium sp.]HOB50967.1 HAD-IIA family hydrolase [Mycobacterium sp.]HPZ95887.1 HAD-IIA family hydrolase [Mycobacterium sp.]HQE15911.1 HAD-IIA family hydrolase [Mycobacterium sp.]
MNTLAQQHDCLLLDLDGTLFRGHSATPGAADTLASVDARALFVTNNASRSAAEVADHLCELGFTATIEDVVTSAQSAARLLSEHLAPGESVLVLGTDALAAEVTAVGLRPVRLVDDGPAAVVQGLSMTIGWPELAEATLAIRDGALWITANLDTTLPTERGLLPGNGSLVAALRAATGATPLVAGKPAPALMQDALDRGNFQAPIVVGDRLDTDIAGANAAGLPSLMVLTGVGTAADAVHAGPALRPTYLGADLRALLEDPAALAFDRHPAWRIEITRDVDGDRVTVHATGADPGSDGLSVVRALASTVWDIGGRRPPAIRAGDPTAETALNRWALLSASID